MEGRRNEGFTLVELIIVIIILGILAALAIPQFSTSAQDARFAALQSNLAVLRNAVSLYYHQHNSVYPGRKTTDGLGTDTTALNAEAAFVDQLTQYTNFDGGTSTSIDRSIYPFGLYFLNGIPVNPMSNLNTVKILLDTDPVAGADIDDATAWIFNVNTGEVKANTTGYLGE